MSYWTAFASESIHPCTLHCTHKYLGELSESAAFEVASRINFFMDSGSRAYGTPASFPLVFTVPAMFGEKGDTEVLLLHDRFWHYIHAFNSLRESLDIFREDDYASYRPHVTIPHKAAPITLRVGRYVLMKDDTIVQAWKL